MTEGAVDVQLRETANAFLSDRGAGAWDAFMLALYAPLERAIKRAVLSLERAEAELMAVTEDEAFDTFLRVKLCEKRDQFLAGLARADAPSAYLGGAVRNHVNDLARRKRPHLNLGPKADAASLVSDDPDGSSDVRDRGSSEDAHAIDSPAEDRLDHSIRDALADLTPKQRALFNAAFGRADDETVAWIAAERSISVERARAEVEARGLALRETREEQERLRDSRLWRLSIARSHLDGVRYALRERGHEPSAVARPDDVCWPGTQRLRRLTAEELRVLEGALVTRVRQAAAGVGELRGHLDLTARPLGTRPDWQGLAILIGALRPDASAEEVATKRNSVEVAFKRIYAELRRRARAGADDV